MKTCSRCGLPDGLVFREDGAALPSIKIEVNEQALCNFCTFYDSDPYDPNKNYLFFLAMIHNVKKKNQKPYDAVIGISGGKDGCYVAYDAVKKYKLNILLYSNQSFQTVEATQKCDEFAEKLETRYPDKVTYIPIRRNNKTYEEYHKMFRSAFLSTGLPCSACTIDNLRSSVSGITTLLSAVPLSLSGAAPEQIYGIVHPNGHSPWLIFNRRKMYNNIEEYNHALITALNKEISILCNNNKEEMESFYNIWNNTDKEFFIKVADEEIRIKEKRDTFIRAINEGKYENKEFTNLAYFLFHEYDEIMIRETLKNELDYIAPPSHSDCCMHGVIEYIFNQFLPYNTNALETAFWVRTGHISKAEAKPIILNEIKSSYPSADDIKQFCDFLQITEEKFKETLEKTKGMLSKYWNQL